MLLACAAGAAAAATTVRSPAELGVAVSAQLACAGVYVSGRPAARVLRDDVRALAPFMRKVVFTVDDRAHAVTATAPDGGSRTSLFRAGVGCTLLTGSHEAADLLAQTQGLVPLPARDAARPWPLGDAPPAGAAPKVNRAALDRAVAAAFTAQRARHADTRAIIVVQHGHIVAERYAPGFDRNTRLLGWSMSKSVVATLAGILVDDGKLALDAAAPVAAWAGDDRRAITLAQLLWMRSGLAFTERYAPGGDAMDMLFASADMAAFAERSPLAAPPDTVWSYSSGTANIVSRIVRDATGGSLATMTNFARERLFGPAGMTSFVMAADESGTPVGSSYMYATARDWARLGLLYLNGGRAGDRRIVSQRWVDFARSAGGTTTSSPYGAHFWLNTGEDGHGTKRFLADLPVDTYCAVGHNFQYVAIIPSRDAVIVRLGWTPEGKSFDVNRHFAHILAALEPAR